MPLIDLRFSRRSVNVFPGRQFQLSLSIHVRGNVEYLMLRLWHSMLRSSRKLRDGKGNYASD